MESSTSGAGDATVGDRPEMDTRGSVVSLKRRGSQMTLELRAERQTGKRKKSLPLTSQRLPEIINEIGMGRYHLITFVILVFTPLAEGAGMIVMTNITHALKHEFHFSNWQAGSLDAFSFSGLAIGHYVAGFLADLKGRRLPIVLGYLGISLVGLFMTLASGYKSMVLLRIFHGIACGVGVPPAMSMIAEIMPSDWRPFMFIIFWSFTAVGETYAALGLIIFMPSLTESTSWKQAVLWSALPAFLMLLSSLARLQESAHWLAVRGHLVEARIVLEQMARMNQKLDVLKKLGTLPACSHDLSILYNVAGINSRGQHLGQGKAFEHASPAEIIRILLQPNILKMVALFSVLASTGNIETFGLSNVWPELLRHEAHGGLHEAVGPAVKLMFIVSVGIPVGVLCALISLSNAASHKIYIMIAGFLGCVGLTCILVFEHSSALLLTSMLITHMSGTLEYSVAMIWCEESFPTKVRASATGVVIFFGTLWSVTSPLLLTAVGEKGFILIAGVAFAMAPLAALPLQETHGAELQDFADEEDEEEDEIEEEDEDEIESSAPRRDGIQLSWAFSNGTIGAAMELSMIAGLLGAVPGVSFTSFYSSMGFIIHQSKDRSFFTKEMLLGNGIAVATHLFLRREEVEVEISVPFQKRLVSIFRRLVLSSLFLAVVNFFMAFCESEMSMLTLGSVQSFFNAILLNTSHALTKPLNRNGSVQLGFLSGALLPILTIPFTGFGPKSSLLSRLAFYLVPSSFCFLIGLLIWAYHRRVAMHLETAQTDDADADAPRNIADLAEAYKNFKVRRNTTGQADQMQTKHFFLAFPAVLCYQMFSYFFAGLFPVLADETGTKTSPLSLYLLMICGDMLGSFIAFIWTSFCEPMELAAAGAAGGGALQICFMALFLLSLLSTTTALFPSVCATHTTSVPLGHSVEPSVIFLVFFFGSFSKAGLEALCPPVLRARLAGVLIGLTAVLLCYEIGTFSKTTEKGRY